MQRHKLTAQPRGEPPSLLGGFLITRGWNDLHFIQCLEVAVIDFRRDLVAGLEALQYIRFIHGVRHRHGTHPARNILIVNGKGFRVRVHLLDFAVEDELLLSSLSALLAISQLLKQQFRLSPGRRAGSRS